MHFIFAKLRAPSTLPLVGCIILGAALAALGLRLPPIPAARAESKTKTGASIHRIAPRSLDKQPHASPIVIVDGARRFAHIAGQTAMNTELDVVGDTLAEQLPVAFANLDHALAAARARRADLVKLTVFYVERAAPEADGKNRPKRRTAAQQVTEHVRGYFEDQPMPAITYLEVPGLVVPSFLVEVEGLAVIPEGGAR